MKKYFIYARKSSDSEDRQILSIEAQLEELKLFIKNKMEDSHIVDEFTEARTAKEPGRPIFNKMLDRIEKGEAEGIIAWHPDRLARNSVDGGKIIHLTDTGKIKYLDFPTYNFENTAQGKFMLNIIFGQSKYYVDNLSENVKRGIRQKLRRGEWPSYARIGYLNNLKTKKIEIDPILAPKIKNIFERYATGNYSLREISLFAESIGLFGRHKQNRISKSNIQRIFTNPIYCGLIKYNGEIYEGKHEKIISRELFDKVQQVLKNRSKQKKIKHNFAFNNGLMKCSVCGAHITAEKQKGHNYYRCSKKKGICNLKYLREEKLVIQINKQIARVTITDNLNQYLKSKIIEEKQTIQNSIADQLKIIDKQINDTENQLNKLLDLYLENELSKRDFGKKKELLIDKKYKLEQQLKHLEKGQFYWLELLSEFINIIPTAKKALETEDLFIKRDFLEKVGSNLKLTAKNSPIKSGGNSPKQKLSTFSKNQQQIPTERKSGGIEENRGSRSNKLQTGNKETVVLEMGFQNLWATVAQWKKEKTSENSYSSAWRY